MPRDTLSALRRDVHHLKAAQSARESAPRACVSVWHPGEAAPSWPDKRPHDLWIVIDLCGEPHEWPQNTVHYTPPPTLALFMGSKSRVRCVVGPIGSGKSTGCVMEVLRRACEQRPGPDGVRRTRFAIIRNSYRELKDTSRKTFSEWVPLDLGSWSEQDFSFRMAFADVQCEVLFRSLDRPEDIKKLLSLELTGAYVNEARELSKQVFDTLTGRVGRYPPMAFGGPTWRGIWMDTNPWHPGHWADKLFRAEPRFQLFRQPGGRSTEAENVEHLDPGYYDELVAGKDSEWIRVYIDGQDASGAVGSIFGALVGALELRGGLEPFDHPADGTYYTTFDLGHSDATAIFWWRIGENRSVEIVEHYENSGKPLSHYFDELDKRSYRVARHFLPHDARAKTLQTGASTLDQFLARYPGRVAIVPQLSIADGLTAARWLLEQPIRIHARCAAAIEALRAYRFEWDEEARAFGTKPVHDWSSHTADAFRYLALCAKHTELISRTAPPPSRDALTTERFSLDDLWNDHERDLGGRRRI